MFYHEYPFHMGAAFDEVSRWSPDYFWGGSSPRRALSPKERARRKARRLMAKKSRKINRR